MLDPFLSLRLFWVLFLLLFLDRIHIYFTEVLALVEELVQCVRGMNGLVLFRRIFAGILEDDLGSTRVLWQDCIWCW